MLKAVKARKRRASQTLLQRLGKAEAAPDEAFEVLAAFFFDLERDVRGLGKRRAALAAARSALAQEAFSAFSAFAQHFASNAARGDGKSDGEDGGEDGEDVVSAGAAAARAAAGALQHDSERAAPLEEAHAAELFDGLLKVQFPEIKESIREWRRRRTDRDSYTRRRQAALGKARKRHDKLRAKGKSPGAIPEASGDVVKLTVKLAAASEEFMELDASLKARLRRLRASRHDLLLGCWAAVVCSHGNFVQGSGDALWGAMRATRGKPRAALEASPLATLPAARLALGLAPLASSSGGGGKTADEYFEAAVSKTKSAAAAAAFAALRNGGDDSERINDEEEDVDLDDSTSSIPISVPARRPSVMEEVTAVSPPASRSQSSASRASLSVPGESSSRISEEEGDEGAAAADDDDDDDEDEEPPAPAPRSRSASRTSPPVPEESSHSEEDHDEDEEPPAPAPRSRSASRTSPTVPTESDDDGNSD
jgi:hypothetical protein